MFVLLDGDEGGCKQIWLYILYYFHCDREIYFRPVLLDVMKCSTGKDNFNGLMVGWAALGGLSTECFSQINLIKFAMTGRKKHHVFILNVPRFNKLKKIWKDRIHALIHMDLGRREIIMAILYI